MPSSIAPQENGALRVRTYMPCDLLVLHALVRHEMRLRPSMSMQGNRWVCTVGCTLDHFRNNGPTWTPPPGGGYCPKANNQHEPKHHKGLQVYPDPLLGHPAWLSFTHMPKSSQPPSSLMGWGGPLYWLAPLLPMPPMCSPRNMTLTLPHQSTSGVVKEIKTKYDQRMVQQQHTDYPPTLTVMSRQQQFWRKLWRLRICQVAQKIAHKIGEHAGTWRPHPVSITDEKGIRKRDQCDWPTNSALRPAQIAWLYGACRRRDQPGPKLPKKWRFTNALHSIIITAITPDKHLGRYRQAYATPPRWDWRCHLPRTCNRPPRHLP